MFLLDVAEGAFNMKFKLISAKERNGIRCYFCGTSKSVKYEVRIFDDVPDIRKRYCCNKCVLVFVDELEDF